MATRPTAPKAPAPPEPKAPEPKAPEQDEGEEVTLAEALENAEAWIAYARDLAEEE